MTYMNIKKGQLKEHTNLQYAIIEAKRLSERLNVPIYTIQVIDTTEPNAPNAGKPWTRRLDEELLYLYMGGNYTPRELARHFGRTCYAICCRLEKFKLCSDADQNYRGW